jgi:5,10-methylenetetrahydromethanopterin reductase
VTPHEVGLGLQGDKPLEAYAHLGRIAEEGGFDVVSVYNDLLFRPAIVPLLLLAQATERVRLGPAALNPFTLHPVEIAGQIAALDSLSGGRAYLGLVRGAWLESIGIVGGRSVPALAEALEVVRRLLSGDRSGYPGERFRLAPGQALEYEILRPRVPLLIGAWGKRTAAFAGREADELKLGGSANPAMIPVMRQRLGSDRVRIVVGAVTVVDEDGAAARRLARAEAALYFPVVAGLDPTLELPPRLVEDVRRLVEAGDRRAAGDLIPDDVLDRLAFSGTPEQVARQAAALYESGAHRVEFGTPQGLTTERGIRLLSEGVLPRLQRAGSP